MDLPLSRPVDIMDAEGEVKLPVKDGKHLKYDIVGSHFPNYDFTVILSHFKGHAMGGFGGAVKNMSIGIASSNGKSNIHSAGKVESPETLWENIAEQDDFLESMAEAAKAVADNCGDNILYISVANNLSVDCDCDSHPANPEMSDIGILASLDPIALDKACTDLVRSSDDHGKIHLIERIDSRHGMHTLDYGEKIRPRLTNLQNRDTGLTTITMSFNNFNYNRNIAHVPRKSGTCIFMLLSTHIFI